MAATLPLRFGGLGLSSARRLRHAAHWARWADCIGMIHQRHPTVARTIIEAIESNNPSHKAQGVVSMESLRTVGFTIPPWEELIRAEPEPSPCGGGRPLSATVWSAAGGSSCCAPHFLGKRVAQSSGRDKRGSAPFSRRSSSVPFTSLPTMRETSFDPQPFRLLLLRRLRLPLPLSACWCQCGRPLIALATTNQRARGRESWGTEAIPWRL